MLEAGGRRRVTDVTLERRHAADQCCTETKHVVISITQSTKILIHHVMIETIYKEENIKKSRMWANAQRDGSPTEYTWRPLFNAAKFG